MISQEFPTLYSMGTGRRMSGQTLMRSGVRHGSGGCQSCFCLFCGGVRGGGGGRGGLQEYHSNQHSRTHLYSNIVSV